MRKTAVGVFESRGQAEAAVDELNRAGFRDDQIGFVTPDGERAAAGGTEVDNTAGGAAAGAVTGGVVGSLIGAAVALLIPGVGPVLAGGVLASALGGAALGAATGGLLGALAGLGISDEEARYYEGEFQSGRTLVTVQAPDRYDEAVAILRRFKSYDYTGRATSSSATVGAIDRTDAGRTTGPATTATIQGRTWDQARSTYREDWQRQSARGKEQWEDVEPGYHYGHEMANDPRYQGRSWNEFEPSLRSDYSTWATNQGYRVDDAGWDRLRERIREAWDRGRGQWNDPTSSGYERTI
jgi:hypothetical protein